MAEPAPYSFDWSASPATKSLAKVKRKPDGFRATSPEEVANIGTRYATPGTNQDSEDWAGGSMENPNVSPVGSPEENPNVTAPSEQPMSGPVTNPNTGTPVFTPQTPDQRASSMQQNWLAQGGSLATLHSAQAAQGIRPRIDARAIASPRDGASPSDAIRAGWGWPGGSSTVSPGNAIWSAMTNNFNNAKQAVQARLNPKPSTVAVSPTPVSPSS